MNKFRRIVKYAGLLLLVALILPLIMIRSGLNKVVKYMTRKDLGDRNRSIDKFVDSLSKKAQADVPPEPTPGPGPGPTSGACSIG